MAIDLSKLLVMNNSVTLTSTTGKERLFQRQEQYTFEGTETRMEGCGCSGGQAEVTYYKVICGGHLYFINASFVVIDRVIREAEYTAQETARKSLRTIPEGGFSQYDNYHPKEELERFNNMARMGSPAAWSAYLMKRTTPRTP